MSSMARCYRALCARLGANFPNLRLMMAIAKDPVCGMDVDTATSKLSLEHEGKTYWFCGKGCLLEFKDDPEKYLDPAYEPEGM